MKLIKVSMSRVEARKSTPLPQPSAMRNRAHGALSISHLSPAKPENQAKAAARRGEAGAALKRRMLLREVVAQRSS